MGLNGHLSIRYMYSTLTFYQKGSYLHMNSPIIELIKTDNDREEQNYNPLIDTKSINALFINRVEDNAYSLL